MLETGRGAGARVRRTATRHNGCLLDIHALDAGACGVRDDFTAASASRSGSTMLDTKVNERMIRWVVGPTSRRPEIVANVATTELIGVAAECSADTVRIVQVRSSDRLPEWQSPHFVTREGRQRGDDQASVYEHGDTLF